MEFISIKQLQSLSKKISKKVKVGDSIYLYGEIGAGKTTFSRFLIQSLQQKFKAKKEEEGKGRYLGSIGFFFFIGWVGGKYSKKKK